MSILKVGDSLGQHPRLSKEGNKDWFKRIGLTKGAVIKWKNANRSFTWDGTVGPRQGSSKELGVPGGFGGWAIIHPKDWTIAELPAPIEDETKIKPGTNLGRGKFNRKDGELNSDWFKRIGITVGSTFDFAGGVTTKRATWTGSFEAGDPGAPSGFGGYEISYPPDWTLISLGEVTQPKKSAPKPAVQKLKVGDQMDLIPRESGETNKDWFARIGFLPGTEVKFKDTGTYTFDGTFNTHESRPNHYPTGFSGFSVSNPADWTILKLGKVSKRKKVATAVAISFDDIVSVERFEGELTIKLKTDAVKATTIKSEIVAGAKLNPVPTLHSKYVK